jgi:hypothetical protein
MTPLAMQIIETREGRMDRENIAYDAPRVRLVRWAGIVRHAAASEDRRRAEAYTLDEMLDTIIDLDLYYAARAGHPEPTTTEDVT